MARDLLRKFALVAVAVGILGFGLLPVQAAEVNVTSNITVSETWTADNVYILTDIIFVANGATLTIEPGTAVRGEPEETSNDPGALVVTRDSKIIAEGTEDLPIVFTDLDDDNIGENEGTFPYTSPQDALSETAKWGGVILLGRGWVAKDTDGAPDPTREEQIEGLEDAGELGLYGNCAAVYSDPLSDPTVCDDDDSGRMKYVSIRYGGFNIADGNEINGLTMGAVGRGTDLEYIEIFQNKDDGVEFFGGAARMKHVAIANVGDDSVDYDQGWRGQMQYVFVFQGLPGFGTDRSDKGGEHDGGGSPDSSQPFAIPTIYNATYIGHGGSKDWAGKLSNTATKFRDDAGGRYYNSFFADFGGAFATLEGLSTDVGSCGWRSEQPYSDLFDGGFYQGPNSGNQLELADNTYYCFGGWDPDSDGSPELPTTNASNYGADSNDAHDPGVFDDPSFNNSYLACDANGDGTLDQNDLPIGALLRENVTGLPTDPDQIVSVDPLPKAGSGLLTSSRIAPDDGFFDPVAFQGAFSDENWAAGWTNMARLGYFTVQVTEDISESTTWHPDSVYELDRPIFVKDGATLTIEPGTIVRGQPEETSNDPGALVVARDSKIIAVGTEDLPIVFTDLDDDNFGENAGTFPYTSPQDALSETAKWGGVILLGRGWVAKDTDGAPDPTREEQIEGLEDAGELGLYGNCAAVYSDPLSDPTVCDDDDSGQMRFVSIRYGGFNIADGNEINGLTMGAVGRGTDLEYIEIFQNKDDGVEFFGGAARMKHVAIANVGDDSVDYDQGWRGQMQYVFVFQGLPGFGTDRSDKGGEHDGGGSPDSSQPFAIPTIYNATYIGHGGSKDWAGKLSNTATKFRDDAGGRYYNSFFADFGGAFATLEGLSTDVGTCGWRSEQPYSDLFDGGFYQGPNSGNQLELADNTYYCFGGWDPDSDGNPELPTTNASNYGADSNDAHDPGVFDDPSFNNSYIDCAGTLPIQALERENVTGLPTDPDQVVSVNPLPAAGSPLLTSLRTAPNDGFFEPVAFQGAFNDENWAAGWTNMARLGYFAPVAVTEDIAVSTTWTADQVYELDRPIFVKDGATLTIEPGTIVRGQPEETSNDPGALVVARDSKINAVGTVDAPIIFTDLGDDNFGENAGTFPYTSPQDALSETAKWGGVILLGRGWVAKDTDGAPDPTREEQIEGLEDAGELGLYGNCAAVYSDPLSDPTVCDDDDSGQMRFVSIRYGGFNIADGNEINGLTMGAVGRGTDLEYIEIFQNKDDGVEFFGGAARMKHVAIANVGDDSVDYDQGWRGQMQYVFVFQGLPGFGTDRSDKGGEHDGGGSPDSSQPFAIPTIYNATYIGHGGSKDWAGKLSNTATKFRDDAGGRYYNSFFADFGGAFATLEGLSTDVGTCGWRSEQPYSDLFDGGFYQGPNSGNQLELADNTYYCFGGWDPDSDGNPELPTTNASNYGADSNDAHDPGFFDDPGFNNSYIDCASTLPILLLDRENVTGLPTDPDQIVSIDPRPEVGTTTLASDRLTSSAANNVDGFFEPVGYQGAFRPGDNWAAGWTNMSRLGYFPTCSESATAIPNEPKNLTFTSETDLVWDAPWGGNFDYYDVLRSDDPANFSSPACPESQGRNRVAEITEVPPVGGAYFYLVRASNACGDGQVGVGENYQERTAGSCPAN